MARKSRGVTLTIFAVLFAILAISNFLKPFHLDPSAGFVFLGTKLTGAANAIMGPLFGIILLVYAYGIWAMRKFALPIAYFFCPWVILNMILFTMKNRNAPPPSALSRRFNRNWHWRPARIGGHPASPPRRSHMNHGWRVPRWQRNHAV